MNYLALVKEMIKNKNIKLGHMVSTHVVAEKAEKAEKDFTETRFTQMTDPYRVIGAKNYWKMHVPAEQRPQWVKEIYGFN